MLEFHLSDMKDRKTILVTEMVMSYALGYNLIR